MLVLSTAHLPKEVLDALSAEDVNMTRTIPHKYGVIVYAHEDNRDGTPAAVETVMLYARKLGCDWINFDADADRLDDLPTWEW